MALKKTAEKAVDIEMLREMSIDDIEAELNTLRHEQFTKRFRSATEDVTGNNPMQFRTMRRNIARLKTVLREKKA